MFREDENLFHDRIAANKVVWLRKFAMSLLKQILSEISIVGRRRIASWSEDYLKQVLGLKAS
jgi:hypothetical protein